MFFLIKKIKFLNIKLVFKIKYNKNNNIIYKKVYFIIYNFK